MLSICSVSILVFTCANYSSGSHGFQFTRWRRRFQHFRIFGPEGSTFSGALQPEMVSSLQATHSTQKVNEIFKKWIRSISNETLWPKNRSFILPRCHLLTTAVLSNLTKHLSLQNIRQLDVTGCTCLPADSFVNATSLMPDLRALLVSDTNLTLSHVLDSLPHCQNLTTLAFSFSEESRSTSNSLDDPLHFLWSDEQSKALRTNFSRIECLKITSTSTVLSFWAIVARILS